MRAPSMVAWLRAPRSTALMVNGVRIGWATASSDVSERTVPVTNDCPAAGTTLVSIEGGGCCSVCTILSSGASSRTATTAAPPPSVPRTRTARSRLIAAKGRLGLMSRPATLGQLRESGWESVPVKEEVRRNAAAKVKAGEPMFPGVLGYDDTVLPQLENALLAGHDVIFLGERGQAKTRMIRTLTELLDEWMPIVAGSEINDDPYDPVSKHGRDTVRE